MMAVLEGSDMGKVVKANWSGGTVAVVGAQLDLVELDSGDVQRRRLGWSLREGACGVKEKNDGRRRRDWRCARGGERAEGDEEDMKYN